MSIHVSPIEFAAVAAYMVIFGFMWRSLAAKLSDHPLGKAMAFIY
ncbi:hypothetical protein [Streptomyces sp. ISL-100]|nr:hypothetical protein [Streptomyces sp. ISL-100]